MPDIAMCLNEECPLKETCYRFTATPSEYWQSYMDFKYEDGCKDYIKVENPND